MTRKWNAHAGTQCCTRPTKAGQDCTLGMVSWPLDAPLPDPKACRHHLTAEERPIMDAYRVRLRAESDQMWAPRNAFRRGDPACWSWPQPSEELLRVTPRDVRVDEMYEWHQERCAICGQEATVTDHSHWTAMVRGLLCHGCNIGEGCDRTGARNVFQKYRERNPASIWNVQEVYFNSFTGEYAEPLPPYDPWKNNPMRGIGL